MLTIVSDTHGETDHRLTGRALAAVRDAERVVHAGDFTTAAVYDAFDRLASDLVAVVGNNDVPALRERLPTEAAFEWGGRRFLVVHGHEHTETGLSMLARQEEADIVVIGHSHRPSLSTLGERLLINPGSHADPRQFEPGHVEIETEASGVRAALRRPDGTVVSEVCQ